MLRPACPHPPPPLPLPPSDSPPLLSPTPSPVPSLTRSTCNKGNTVLPERVARLWHSLGRLHLPSTSTSPFPLSSLPPYPMPVDRRRCRTTITMALPLRDSLTSCRTSSRTAGVAIRASSREEVPHPATPTPSTLPHPRYVHSSHLLSMSPCASSLLAFYIAPLAPLAPLFLAGHLARSSFASPARLLGRPSVAASPPPSPAPPAPPAVVLPVPSEPIADAPAGRRTARRQSRPQHRERSALVPADTARKRGRHGTLAAADRKVHCAYTFHSSRDWIIAS